MQNPTDNSRTPASRADRLRARRPTRPALMVAGIAALATATGVGIASGAPAADDSHTAAVAVAAAGTPGAATGTGADALAARTADDRGDAAAARGTAREAPVSAESASSGASGASGSAKRSGGTAVSDVLAAKQHAEAREVFAAAEQKAAAEAAERARVEAEQQAAAAAAAAAQAQAAAQAAAAQAAAQAAAAQPAKAPAPAAAPAAAAISDSDYVRPVAGAGHGSYGRSGSLWSHGHTGEDFSAGMGSSVKAVTSGTVVKAGWGGAYGNEIVIRHPDGKYTQYGHLSKFSVKAGQKVATGQQIALSGSTGNSTGPHLHFEVRTGPNYGSDVNPIAYLRAKGVAI
ncbi:M23 family metallopeptidase [Yinghuangia sp. YIM S09857]|uniref:M23 family metallopeptidase n=1 Tax=Yinghuangia sp. YIM S09857 TaxID=3436929 RepID=UPI003F52B570